MMMNDASAANVANAFVIARAFAGKAAFATFVAIAWAYAMMHWRTNGEKARDVLDARAPRLGMDVEGESARRATRSRDGRTTRASAPARMERIEDEPSAKARNECGQGETSASSFDAPPPPSVWGQRPLYMKAESYAKCELSSDTGAWFNAEEPFEFETPVFRGACLCRFRDVAPPPGARADAAERLDAYFKGKKRTFQVVIQGQFKRQVRMDTVVTGHEFFAPLVNVPGAFVLRSVLRVLRALSKSLDVRVFGSRPRVYASFGGTAQAMSVDERGSEPDIATLDGIEENTRRLGGAFASGVAAKKRKKMLSSSRVSRNYAFNTSDVYTFDSYQHIFVPRSYQLNLGFRSVELAHHLNGQPAQIMAKIADGEYLYCFSLWHEKLIAT